MSPKGRSYEERIRISVCRVGNEITLLTLLTLQNASRFGADRWQLAAAMHRFALAELEKVKQEVEHADAMVLAVDLWSSRSNHSFLCVLAFYLDTMWRHRCRMIGFENIPEDHTGENIAKNSSNLQKTSIE